MRVFQCFFSKTGHLALCFRSRSIERDLLKHISLHFRGLPEKKYLLKLRFGILVGKSGFKT